ncbi:MAG: hypothetical protein EBS06_05625 [Proteobacteria bacterium]|nr:hypothetical protein [Pseudomonadota bacterium]
MSQESNRQKVRLLTVNQFIEAHPFMTSGGLRALIFQSRFNDLDKKKVIKRIGRKILLDEAAFFEWLNERSEVNHV